MRIVAGSARGRQIETIDGLSTRPTLDRVREAVFGSLQFRIPGASFLDLFSGSGAMGLEAASRGAGYVLMNDLSPDCVKMIKKNAQTCGLSDKITVTMMDYHSVIDQCARQGRTFDIAYLDAPYASGFSAEAAKELFSRGLVREDGMVLLEHVSEESAPDLGLSGIHAVRTRKYGKCSVTEYMKDETI